MDDKKEQVLKHIYDFFVTSADFNGIPLRQIGRELNISYKKSIDIIKELVSEDKCMIQSATNPHIIRLTTYTIPSQLNCLEDAKGLKTQRRQMGNIVLESENTEFPICVYPSQTYLHTQRNVKGMPLFTRLLAWGEPQLTP